jgi:hypothetical protein
VSGGASRDKRSLARSAREATSDTSPPPGRMRCLRTLTACLHALTGGRDANRRASRVNGHMTRHPPRGACYVYVCKQIADKYRHVKSGELSDCRLQMQTIVCNCRQRLEALIFAVMPGSSGGRRGVSGRLRQNSFFLLSRPSAEHPGAAHPKGPQRSEGVSERSGET